MNINIVCTIFNVLFKKKQMLHREHNGEIYMYIKMINDNWSK